MNWVLVTCWRWRHGSCSYPALASVYSLACSTVLLHYPPCSCLNYCPITRVLMFLLNAGYACLLLVLQLYYSACILWSIDVLHCSACLLLPMFYITLLVSAPTDTCDPFHFSHSLPPTLIIRAPSLKTHHWHHSALQIWSHTLRSGPAGGCEH